MQKFATASALALAASGEEVQGGTVAITFSDCGTASTHGKISDVQPREIQLGSEVTLVGKGTVDEDVTGGAFKIEAKAGGGLIDKTWNGDVCKPLTIDIPLGLGTVTWKGMNCPVKAGDVSVELSAKISGAVPASLATADIALSGTGTAGEDLLCVNFHLKQKKTTTHAKGFVRMPRNSPVEVATITDEMRAAAPDRLDWVEKGGTSPVKDQGGCGSCWAFSATQGIESGVFMASGSLPPALSTQQIISCDKTDLGCSGGDIASAFEYVQKDGGIDSDSDYPDRSHEDGKTGQCKSHGHVVKVTDYKYAVPPCQSGACEDQDEDGLKAALNTYGPLSVCVNAAWNSYHGGVLEGDCSGGYWDLDHCVQLVGYDTTASTPYWKVKNSWNTRWGEQGYIRLPMGRNSCGIANEAMYVTATMVSQEATV